VAVRKQTPAELRLKKEFAEMDLPPHASISFPKENDLMNFCVVIDLAKEDECLWRQGKYLFRIAVPTGYPH
jgi:ubiquitin-conjugating enzyme E2 M